MSANRDVYVAERQYFLRHPGLPYRLEARFLHSHSEQGDLPPSQLLAAKNRIVPFVGRDREINELESWRDADLPSSAMLLYGPGGQGKTRLADYLFSTSGEIGWRCYVARHVSELGSYSRPDESEPISSEHRGLMVIVDYAERWPLEDLLLLASDLNPGEAAPVRVLFLARPSSWWAPMRHKLSERGWDVRQMSLGSLAQTIDDRVNIFEQARNRFATLLGSEEAKSVLPTVPLSDDRFGLALSLHMAALAAVDAYLNSATAPADPALLSTYLLDRERAYWTTLRSGGRIRLEPHTMARAVFAAILAGPLPYAYAAELVQRIGLSSSVEPANMVLDDHKACYPTTDAGDALEPIYPDRLAEDFIAIQLPGNAGRADDVDAWSDAGLQQLAEGLEDVPPSVTQRLLTVLLEASYRWEHVAHEYLIPILSQRPHLGMTLGGAGVLRLVDMPYVDAATLMRVDEALPAERHLDFDLARAALGKRLASVRLENEQDPIQRAFVLADIGLRLRAAGDFEEALRYVERAIETLVPLERHSSTHDPAIAPQLINQSGLLAELGRYEEASAVATACVDRYRRLVAYNEDLFSDGLASALANLAMSRLRLNDPHGAIDPLVEATNIRRKLSRDDPEKFEPDFAASLDNLGIVYSSLGRMEESLRVTEDAVRIYRRLSSSRPGRFDHELAAALDNLGGRQQSLAKLDEALNSTAESVSIYLRLADTNPRFFNADLALALINFAHMLWLRDERSEALNRLAHAADLKKDLAKLYPNMHSQDLPDLMMLLGTWLHEEEMFSAASDAFQDAIDSYVANGASQKFEVDAIAHAFDLLGISLSEQERHEDALNASLSSVSEYQKLAAADDSFVPDLTMSMSNLGIRYSELGRHGEALHTTKQAIDNFKDLISSHPEIQFEYAIALGAFASARMRAAVELEDALKAIDEALAILSDIREEDPDQTVRYGMRLFQDRIQLLEDLGRHAEADQVRRWLADGQG